MTSRTIFAGAALILAATAVNAMDELDANGDGLVTYEEMLAAVPEATEDAFSQIDTNGDGALDADEFAAAQESGVLPVASGG